MLKDYGCVYTRSMYGQNEFSYPQAPVDEEKLWTIGEIAQVLNIKEEDYMSCVPKGAKIEEKKFKGFDRHGGA